MSDHNHITRDIKPLWGGCPGCDEYHVSALRKQVDGYEAIARGMVAQARRELLDALRVEAKGLPVLGRHINHADDCPGRPGYRGICNCDRAMDELVSLDAVLRMLDEQNG